MARSAKRQFLVVISFASGLTVKGYWAQSTGGHSQVDATDHWDGGSTEPESTLSNVKYTNMVLTRWYDPGRDQPVEQACRAQIASGPAATISSTPCDGALVPVASATVWTGKLIEVQGPELDSDSGDSATLALTFHITKAR